MLQGGLLWELLRGHWRVGGLQLLQQGFLSRHNREDFSKPGLRGGVARPAWDDISTARLRNSTPWQGRQWRIPFQDNQTAVAGHLSRFMRQASSLPCI